MSSLHIVNTSNSTPWQHCQDSCAPNHSIVLYSDGVCHALDKTLMQSLSQQGIKLFALNSDCQARGLDLTGSPVTTIDYDTWVDLSAEHQNCLNWS